MKCMAWHEQIAYLVDGEPSTAALEQHLSACEECRALLTELRSDQQALRTVWTPPSKPRIRFRTAAAALAIAASLALVILWPRPVPVIVPQAQVPAAPPRIARPAPVQAAAIAPVKRKPIHRPAEHRVPNWEEFLDEFGSSPKAAEPSPQSSGLQAGVRIPTTDPNVVIWMIQPELHQKGTP